MNLKKIYHGIPLSVRTGLIGIIIAFSGIAGFYGMTYPWAGNDDQMFHIDYVWQVSQGQLPEYGEGTQYPFMAHYPRQFVSNHPPLYYLIQAPLLKAPLESGDWQLAVKIGRMINILIGIACILAFAWAGWVFSNGNRVLTLLVAIVAAFHPNFISIIGVIMNDSLIVLFSTLAITLSYLIIKRGPNARILSLITLVCSLGMLSRVTFVIPLAISIIAVFVSYIINNKAKLVVWRKILPGVVVATLVLAISIAPASLFYMRNFEQSGSFHKSSDGTVINASGRDYKSLGEVLTSPSLYSAATINPFAKTPLAPDALVYTMLMLMTIASVTIWLKTKNRRSKIFKDKKLMAITGLISMYLFLVFMSQVLHAWGYGQYSPRYFLPGLLPLSILIALGVYFWKRQVPAIVIGLIVVASYISVWKIVDRLQSRAAEKYEALSFAGVIVEALHTNSVPVSIVIVSMLMFVTGIIIIFIVHRSLSQGSKDEKKPRTVN